MNWQILETRNGYTFWYYEQKDERRVYNCTTDGQPPKTDGGYYYYGYLLKVKGLLKGDTLTSIFANL